MSIELKDVAVVGELNVDVILNRIEGMPVVGKEIIAKDMVLTLGSSSAIFASNLSTLGAKVGFIGRVGTDNFANIVLESLKAKNVDFAHIIQSETANTGATIVLNYGQDRANVTYPGAMDELSVRDIDFNYLKGFKHLHVSSLFMQPALKTGLVELFKTAKEMGLSTSADPQWDPAEKWDISLKELLPWIDVFMPNNVEIMALTGTNSISEAIYQVKNLSNCIVVKDGSNGALCWNGSDILHRPAFINNQVVDCIGAGDSFNAGFIRKFVEKQPLQICLEFGALTGAINTTKAGGTGAFDNLESIRKTAHEIFGFAI